MDILADPMSSKTARRPELGVKPPVEPFAAAGTAAPGQLNQDRVHTLLKLLFDQGESDIRRSRDRQNRDRHMESETVY